MASLCKTILFLLPILAILGFGGAVHAADYFVTPTGAGSNDGSDWAHAFAGRPPSFEKGSTYYIAGGDYTDAGSGIGWRWQIENPSGSGPLRIVKATEENSGHITGYQTGFGETQAIFATNGACSTSYFNSWGAFVIDTDEVVINGSYKHGIKIVEGPDDWQPFWPTGNFKVGILVKGGSDLAFENILFDFSDDPDPTQNPYVKIGIYDWLNDPENLQVMNCRFNKGHLAVRGTGRNNYRIIHCVFYDFSAADPSFPGWPGSAILDLAFSDSGEISRNRFKNCHGTGGHNRMVEYRGSYAIHANLFVGCTDYKSALYGGTDTKVHNNTLAECHFQNNGDGHAIHFGSYSNGNEAYNNLFLNVTLDSEAIIFGITTSDYNWCWDGTDNGVDECARMNMESNSDYFGYGDACPDLFVDRDNDLYTLTGALAGLSLSASPASFGIDLDGKPRGEDGIWDKGAYEFDAGAGGCVGDISEDKDVDGEDLFLLAGDLGKTGCSPAQCPGDLDQDGDVDPNDVKIFASGFGNADCP